MYIIVSVFSVGFPFFGCLSSPPRVGYLEPYGVFFIQKFLANCDMPPYPRGCRPSRGVLSASSGDRLRCVSSGLVFLAHSVGSSLQGLTLFVL